MCIRDSIYNDVTMVWSSSGVINAIDDFQMYDYDIGVQSNKSTGCHDAIQATTA